MLAPMHTPEHHNSIICHKYPSISMVAALMDTNLLRLERKNFDFSVQQPMPLELARE